MPKSNDDRINDTLAYLKDQVPRAHYEEVERLAEQRDQRVLGELLSLDWSNPLFKTRRRAVRANLLCAQALVTDPMWRAVASGDVAEATLKAASEDQLRKRLRTWWRADGVTVDSVCATARRLIGTMPLWANDPFDAGRSAGPGSRYNGGGFNCFNGVVYWAYCGGALSLTWLFDTWAPSASNDPVGARRKPMMGLDDSARVWTPEDLVDGQYPIPPGHTVQFVNPGTAFGHVVMSLGRGLCISQNDCQAFDISVFARGELRPEDPVAIARMRHRKTHIASIRTLQRGYYNEKNGYIRLISAAPFWL